MSGAKFIEKRTGKSLVLRHYILPASLVLGTVLLVRLGVSTACKSPYDSSGNVCDQLCTVADRRSQSQAIAEVGGKTGGRERA